MVQHGIDLHKRSLTIATLDDSGAASYEFAISWERLEDLPVQLRDEISHFFSVYKTLEQKAVEVDGFYPLEDALAVIEDSRKRWAERPDG